MLPCLLKTLRLMGVKVILNNHIQQNDHIPTGFLYLKAYKISMMFTEMKIIRNNFVNL